MIAPSLVLLALSLAAGLTLWNRSRREHAGALAWRAALLDEARRLFPDGRSTLGPDGFPSFRTVLPDGRTLGLEVIVDTLVTRRLPQLWLRLTLRHSASVRGFSIGALARPTGSEFFSLVHEMPEWLAPPQGDVPLLVRGRGIGAEEAGRARETFREFFADPCLKEALVTPRSVSILRQACTGDRAAHLLLRQAKFGLETVPAADIQGALREAGLLDAALRAPVLAIRTDAPAK